MSMTIQERLRIECESAHGDIGPQYLTWEAADAIDAREVEIAKLKADDKLLRTHYDTVLLNTAEFRKKDWERIAALEALLTKVRDSFLYAEDEGAIGVMQEAENHYFDEICAALKLAGA